jgi:hypothetical protein
MAAKRASRPGSGAADANTWRTDHARADLGNGFYDLGPGERS